LKPDVLSRVPRRSRAKWLGMNLQGNDLPPLSVNAVDSPMMIASREAVVDL